MRVFILAMVIIYGLFFGKLPAQSGWGIGGSGLYNISNNYLGMSARLLIPVKEDLWAVPYIFYYFKSGELSGGISGMKIFYKQGKFAYYVIASGTFRGEVSVSVNDSTAGGSKSYKAEGEAGLGVLIGNGCLRGFVEPRYAIRSEEVTLRAGLVYFLGCKGSKKKSKAGRKGGGKTRNSSAYSKKKRTVCPAYD
ncbi:MAG: hypothetical protein JXR58_12545 [Bacteroidales bacterium]|nr:hypothetical protein [Bacteroidales bacterium]